MVYTLINRVIADVRSYIRWYSQPSRPFNKFCQLFLILITHKNTQTTKATNTKSLRRAADLCKVTNAEIWYS